MLCVCRLCSSKRQEGSHAALSVGCAATPCVELGVGLCVVLAAFLPGRSNAVMLFATMGAWRQRTPTILAAECSPASLATYLFHDVFFVPAGPTHGHESTFLLHRDQPPFPMSPHVYV